MKNDKLKIIEQEDKFEKGTSIESLRNKLSQAQFDLAKIGIVGTNEALKSISEQYRSFQTEFAKSLAEIIEGQKTVHH